MLARSSLLRRRAALADEQQPLAANIDLVLLVTGVDRPVKSGRLSRGAALAWDAGATPVVVLTKAALGADVPAIVAMIAHDHPALDVIVTSVDEGVGLDELRGLVAGHTATLLGESGAGKSSIVNALLGTPAARIGRVRKGDSKGRHTTTTRELHVLPSGGVLVDTPGIRSVGLWVDSDAVDVTFADVEELATHCRFADCGHRSEPGCAVRDAVERLGLPASRVDAWRELQSEAGATAARVETNERRGVNRRYGRVAKDPQRRKGRS